MGNSGSTTKIAIAIAIGIIASFGAVGAIAAIVAGGLLCLSSSSAQNSHDHSAELDGEKSKSSSVPSSHHSAELDNGKSKSSSGPNSHLSAELHYGKSKSASVPNSHHYAELLYEKSKSSSPNSLHYAELDRAKSKSSSVPNSHHSAELDNGKSKSSSVPNSHHSAELHYGKSKSSSVPNSYHYAELHCEMSKSSSVPNSHHYAELDCAKSKSSSVSNSHHSAELGCEKSKSSSVTSVTNSQGSCCLDSVQPIPVSFRISLESVLIDLLSGFGTTGWQFPPIGWVKCNVDGSSRKLQHSAGCGGVYRDGQGKWVNGFARKLYYCCSMKAEILAIYTGLADGWRLGFRNLIIESDSQSAVDLVNRGCSATCKFAKTVKKARKYLRKEWQVNIVHIPREYNEVADWLSKFSHNLHVGVHELKKPPKDCSKFLLEDKSSAICLPKFNSTF